MHLQAWMISGPAVWFVAPLAVIGCLYFMISLPTGTQVRFAIWNLIGVGVHLAYGPRRSLLAQAGS